ncbi:MAG: hypothetical protein ACU84Q_13940 [Gammaproteobacteria bacterium]
MNRHLHSRYRNRDGLDLRRFGGQKTTEYEIVDALFLLPWETGDYVANFVGVLFGYLALVYFVGAKLGPLQV